MSRIGYPSHSSPAPFWATSSHSSPRTRLNRPGRSSFLGLQHNTFSGRPAHPRPSISVVPSYCGGFDGNRNVNHNNRYTAASTLPYSTVHDFGRAGSYSPTEYEDLDFFYEKPPNEIPSECDFKGQLSKHSTTTTRSIDSTPPPPPPLPPVPIAPKLDFQDSDPTLHSSVYISRADTIQKQKTNKCNCRLYAWVALLVVLALLLACSIIAILWFVQSQHSSTRNNFSHNATLSQTSFDRIVDALRSPFVSRPNYDSPKDNSTHFEIKQDISLPYTHKILRGPEHSENKDADILNGGEDESVKSVSSISDKKKMSVSVTESLIEPNQLLTLIITKRKMCLFEASTTDLESSRQDFRRSHLPSSRLLLFSSLSHNGVPVHPLQFQRFIRSLGVDSDCHIVVYSRRETVWATYAFWIFKLYGHSKVSVLNGGLEQWKALSEKGTGPYTMESDQPSSYEQEKMGDFRAEWVSDYIATFDDVFANFDHHQADIVDAQPQEEFNGKSAGTIIFGHIRTAVNIPSTQLYDIANQTWIHTSDLEKLFRDRGLSPTRSVIVYDGTNTVEASMIWFALHRLHYQAAVYFGSWAEWIIRAPDYLKVIPNGE
ncbi:rhodanese-like domain-containing protein [Ditylenchus destructor]|uniref:Rhodanese-like domain-containing protein n=1 Tax=Ditylenchus destructor TaxID=166010 RepID=A0AAD4NB12_9BILA|nr:rhodanese-like domain-containing protein [Ditylenchus destructor]